MVRNRREDGRLGVRHFQVLLVFLGLTIAYAKRVNLSLALVAMTDRHSANPDFVDFDWDHRTQATILSSFFWGYIITQLPAGQLAERFGPKLIIFYAMVLSSILTLVTPICSTLGGWKLLCAVRVVEGLCQGVLFPSSHTMLSKWAPISERAQLGTYCYSGAQFGTVLMLSCSGFLASSAMGWPSIFYFSGAAGCLWTILWYICACNSPSEYKNISAEEKQFIESSLPTTDETVVVETAKKSMYTPWSKIFTSIPFYSLIIVHACHNWGYWTLLTKMPAYMKSVLEFDIKANALLSSLPYLAMLIMCFVFSWSADRLIKNKILAPKYSRKLYNSIGHWIPMLALIGLGFVTKDHPHIAIGLLILAVGANAAAHLGFQVNHIDLAPNYAGTLMGITNGIANIISIIAPLMVGVIVTEESNLIQWRTVFLISAGVYFIGNLLFVIFSTTDLQPWNEPPKNTSHENGVANGNLRIQVHRQVA